MRSHHARGRGRDQKGRLPRRYIPAMIMWNTKKERNGFRGKSAKYKSSARATRSKSTCRRMFRSTLCGVIVQSRG